MSDTNVSVGSGASFSGLLTIAFIVLKLTGVITWSWAWVLAPLWIGLAAVFAIILVVVAVILMIACVRKVFS